MPHRALHDTPLSATHPLFPIPSPARPHGLCVWQCRAVTGLAGLALVGRTAISCGSSRFASRAVAIARSILATSCALSPMPDSTAASGAAAAGSVPSAEKPSWRGASSDMAEPAWLPSSTIPGCCSCTAEVEGRCGVKLERDACDSNVPMRPSTSAVNARASATAARACASATAIRASATIARASACVSALVASVLSCASATAARASASAARACASAATARASACASALASTVLRCASATAARASVPAACASTAIARIARASACASAVSTRPSASAAAARAPAACASAATARTSACVSTTLRVASSSGWRTRNRSSSTALRVASSISASLA
eukprot:scaffold14677_cov50-Phaeocystis_antarctica.AAC.1